MLNNIKKEIEDIIGDIDTLKSDIDYYCDEETTEDMDFNGWYKTFKSIIKKLEYIIKED